MEEEQGVAATPPGHSAEPEPVPVSAASAASVPNADATCEGCRFASPYPPPKGPKPELIEPPKMRLFDGPATHLAWDIHMNSVIFWAKADQRARLYIQCRRFPKFVERKKHDACGEWAAQGIEARRAETGTGSVHESPVP